MAKKEGSVAPKERINVTFKPATGNATEEIELPMKVMVLGDFIQRQDDRPLAERKPVSVNRNNFSDVMASQELTLDIAVSNTLQDGHEDEEIPIHLQFSSMRDFEPGNLLEQIPEARKLLQLRDALISLKGPMGNIPGFRKALEETIRDPAQRDEIRRELAEAGIQLSLTAPKDAGRNPKADDGAEPASDDDTSQN